VFVLLPHGDNHDLKSNVSIFKIISITTQNNPMAMAILNYVLIV